MTSTERPQDVVVIAASAGGIKALQVVLADLPADLPAAVLVVQHLDPHHRSTLADILGRRCPLPVSEAEHGEPLMSGHVYIAPPGHHLLIGDGSTVELTITALVHFVRPAADLLFESAADQFGERVTGVVLTGTGVDASMGVQTIKAKGGTVIAQDEASSEFFGMPGSAAATGDVDVVLPVDAIAKHLVAHLQPPA